MPKLKRERLKVLVRGAVQGVGFRPFVHRLATELLLDGWVLNSSQGVFIEVEGAPAVLRSFLLRLEKERPSRAVIQSLEPSFLDPVGHKRFEIRESDEGGEKTALILPDIATCADCLHELFDSTDRRFRYPFTNCTNCGPRFSIIEALPYDRAHTSMKKFPMCAECDREYRDPFDRRFHAQPNACPRCGPQVELWSDAGKILARGDGALEEAAGAVRSGRILALKGLGGFQLIVDATNEGAVRRLRERKHREEKPFAVMVSSLAAAQELCRISEMEERLLTSAESPIVLLQRKKEGQLALSIAPRNPNLGVLLPNTPLHHLLLHSLGVPVVATSGNLCNEPICIDEREALERLRGIADLFLVHNRPIVRHMDDSIVRVMAGRELLLRGARGYAPLPIEWQSEVGRQKSKTVLALGAHLKNTVALASGRNVFISQHLGDLENAQSYAAFLGSTADLPRLYDATPKLVACDLHPDYLSTKYAAELSAPVRTVQHHWAHVAACMAENELTPPLLGVAWDGTGFGDDGTVWGGEFLSVDAKGFTRTGHLRQFRLPGGDAAVKEPRRSKLGVLYEIFGGDELWQREDLLQDFTKSELTLLRQTLDKKINAPLTSSAGRLFDATASLLGIGSRASFEGQAAMELEFAVQSGVDESYSFVVREGSPLVVDWQPTILQIIEDLRSDQTRALVGAKFHNALAEMIVTVARRIEQQKVVLSGGCFQNRYLTERTIERLSEEGFRPYWHQRVPPNDGGISLGQVVAATMQE
ncbi:MAG: carbamoyltransferase HypF [Chthoniobacterales bacterium]|nr:carbamoyltransferase HypF [Chthoniobacterales bacterium]